MGDLAIRTRSVVKIRRTLGSRKPLPVADHRPGSSSLISKRANMPASNSELLRPKKCCRQNVSNLKTRQSPVMARACWLLTKKWTKPKAKWMNFTNAGVSSKRRRTERGGCRFLALHQRKRDNGFAGLSGRFLQFLDQCGLKIVGIRNHFMRSHFFI